MSVRRPHLPAAVLRQAARQIGHRCLNPALPWPVQRTRLDQMTRISLLPRGTTITEQVIAGHRAEVVSAPGADASRTVLHFHGGGYCVGSALTPRTWAAYLSARTGWRVVLPEYRLAPSTPTRPRSTMPVRSGPSCPRRRLVRPVLPAHPQRRAVRRGVAGGVRADRRAGGRAGRRGRRPARPAARHEAGMRHSAGGRIPLVAAGAGVIDVVANICYVAATRTGSFGLAVVLASLYPGVTVLLARVVLGERLRWVQRLGLALAAFGILLVAA
jgi:hypothetical protein